MEFRTNEASRRALIALIGLTSVPWAVAQTATTTNASLELEEVVVTAQKRRERIQDVPVSVAVQSGAALERAQVDSIVDLGARFANLAMPDPGAKGQNIFIRIRGFGNNFATRTLRAGIVVDDVPYLSPRGLNGGLFEIEQAQVLRGPQSTLYGLTAEAGLVIVETVKPNLSALEGRLAVKLGSEGEYQTSGRISVPVVQDRFAVSLSAFAAGGDGWIKNVVTGRGYNESQNWGARVQALAQVSDALSIQLQIARETVNDKYGLALAPINRTAFNTTFGTNLREFQSAQDYAGYTDNKDESAALTVRWNFGAASLIAVSAWRKFETLPSFDIDQGPLLFRAGPFSIRSGQAETGTKALSQELRFESRDDAAIRWTAGAFYYKTEETPIATASIVAPIQILRVLGPRQISDFESSAAFGQLGHTWDKLTLSAGARFEKISLKHQQDGITRTAKFSDDAFLPKLSLTYALNPAINLYGSVGRGWLAGGVYVGTTPANDLFYDSETSTTYELGVKGEWLDKRLSANFAVFRTNANAYQESIRTGLITARTSNAGKVSFKGFEFELAARLTETLTLNLDAGVSDAKYQTFVEFDPATGALIDRAGNRVPGVAEHDFNAALTYRNPRGWFVMGEVSGSGNQLEIKDTLNILPTIDGFAIVNLRTGYDTDRWSVGVYCENVGDKEYFVYGNNQLGNGVVFGTPGRSRLVGVSAQYRFGAKR